MKSTTPWQRVHPPKFPRLNATRDCDVLVVGGGITGLTAAYLLKQAGKSVVVLERDRIGGGDTGCTTAHLTMVTDSRITELVRRFGKEGARLAWEGGLAAVNTIEDIATKNAIECDFQRVPGYLVACWHGSHDERRQLKRDTQLAGELGFSAQFLAEVPLLDRPGVRFGNQATFHPMKYLKGLAQAIHGGGSAIHEQSEAEEFDGVERVTVNGKQIRCRFLVIATHVPLAGESGMIDATLFQTKLTPYTSYVVSGGIPRGVAAPASYWDTSDPYYYLRIDRAERRDRAILGGLDRKTGQDDRPEKRFADLEVLLKKLIAGVDVDHRWSGQVIETHDGLPYIGQTSERQFVATGFAGNGMTFGTLAGMMACDAALGRSNPWKELFAVNRRKLSAAWNFVKENIDYPYFLIRDRVLGSEARSTREIKRGEGKIVKGPDGRVACSRDEDGKLSCVSAICTHMGCVVHWNPAERTWDCPCHGSRFLATGEVLAGPAESPLETVHAPKAANGQREKVRHNGR